MEPAAFAALLNRFYAVSQEVLLPQRAVIDKMVGDEIMSFFIPSIEPAYRRRSVEAAIGLQRALLTADNGKPLLPVGIGIHAGSAFVGKVGSNDVSDFTAIGDTVNTASRLQSIARAGEIAISQDLMPDAPPEFASAELRSVDIRGHEKPLEVRVVKIG